MIGKNRAEKTLLAFGWLSHLPEDQAALVTSQAHVVELQAGQPLYHIGDPPGGIYGIARGRIGIGIAPATTGPYLAHLFGVGSWFGEAAVITEQPRRVSTFARNDTLLLHLPLFAIRKIISGKPEFWCSLAAIAVYNLDLAYRAFDASLNPDAAARVAAALLRLADDDFALATNTQPNEITITQSELAELVRLSRNGVGQVLTRLTETGLITHGYNRIALRDRSSLRDMATSR